MSGFRLGLNEATKDCFEGSSPRSKVSNLSLRASSLVPPRSGEIEILEDELDELRSEAAFAKSDLVSNDLQGYFVSQ